MSSVLVGMFDSQADAERARIDLVSGGFPASAISMTGGPVASTVAMSSGVATSAAPEHEGTISHWLRNLFGDDDEDETTRSGYSDTYKEALRRGSYGVSVTAANDTELEMAERILSEAGAVDIDERSQKWREEGWTGGQAYVAGSGGASATGLESGTTAKLQEVEEELKVGKRTVARGGVRVFSRMTETPVEESVMLREEHADIQRRAVDRPATEADFAAFKEGTIEVRESAEEAVVSKTARVVGEVVIGKTATEREETVHDTVRKTTVDVEPIAGGTATETSQAAYANSDTERPKSTSTGSLNRDPITGTPGAHPVGTGLGATAGGIVAGATAGTVAGPVGTVVGAAVGAVAGGLAGKGVAEKVDPTVAPDSRKL